MELSKRTLKRMENLEPYCDFDTENAVATLHLRFKNASDLIDKTIGGSSAPMISSDTLELLKSLQETVPAQFKVNYQISIEDYNGYDSRIMENALSKAAELQGHRKKQDRDQKHSKMAAFLLVGFVLLLFVIFNAKYHWFGFAGLPLSALIAYLLELAFELYFEEGIVHFLINRCYEKSENRSKLGIIRCV